MEVDITTDQQQSQDQVPSPTASAAGTTDSDSAMDCSSSISSSSSSSSGRRTRGYNLRRTSVVTREESEKKRCKPREPKPKSKPPPLSKYRRKTANARERGRMQDINEAFEELRLAVPQLPGSEGKLTKITTLRLAMNYIEALREMLRAGPEEDRADMASTSDLGSTGSHSDICSSPGGDSRIGDSLADSSESLSSPSSSPSLDFDDKLCLGALDAGGDSFLF